MSRLFKDLYFGIQSITGINGVKGLSWKTKLTLLIPNFVWNIYDHVYNFINWIKKSLSYAWFLKNDRDWEPSDILRLLHFKLTRVKKCLVGNEYRTEDHDKEMSDLINTMLDLIEKVNEHNYGKELREAFDNKYGEVISWCDKEIGPDGKQHNYFKLRYANTKTEEEVEQAHQDLYEIGLKEDELRNKDLKQLFNLMAEKIDYLWD